MGFREVAVTEIREVLRAWLGGAGLRRVAERAGVDRKTARRYVEAAVAAGLARDGGSGQLSDELIGVVAQAVRPVRPAGHGRAWEQLAACQQQIETWVKDGLTVVKIGVLLERRGVAVPYRTLHRFCVARCGFVHDGRRGLLAPTLARASRPAAAWAAASKREDGSPFAERHCEYLKDCGHFLVARADQVNLGAEWARMAGGRAGFPGWRAQYCGVIARRQSLLVPSIRCLYVVTVVRTSSVISSRSRALRRGLPATGSVHVRVTRVPLPSAVTR